MSSLSPAHVCKFIFIVTFSSKDIFIQRLHYEFSLNVTEAENSFPAHLVISSVITAGHRLLPLPCLPKSWKKHAVLLRTANILINFGHTCSSLRATTFVPSGMYQHCPWASLSFKLPRPPLPCTPSILPLIWDSIFPHTGTLLLAPLDTFGGSLS